MRRVWCGRGVDAVGCVRGSVSRDREARRVRSVSCGSAARRRRSGVVSHGPPGALRSDTVFEFTFSTPLIEFRSKHATQGFDERSPLASLETGRAAVRSSSSRA